MGKETNTTPKTTPPNRYACREREKGIEDQKTMQSKITSEESSENNLRKGEEEQAEYRSRRRAVSKELVFFFKRREREGMMAEGCTVSGRAVKRKTEIVKGESPTHRDRHQPR